MAHDLATLQKSLGHRFSDRGLLIQALTHRSYANEQGADPADNNERLEFLGDGVVNLCVAAMLMERLPVAREGTLTKLRARLVSERSLANAARTIRLGDHLLLGRGEEASGGRRKDSILSDTFEAVVAALYLDGGFARADLTLQRLMRPLVRTAMTGGLDRDHKGRLQELTQARCHAIPRYRVAETHGPDHDKVFVVAVSLEGEELSRAEGPSKKVAEQRAAKHAVEALETE